MANHAGHSSSVQLLVVGAGPVGLFCALAAAKRGVDVSVIDQVWRGYAPGHATLLHARSLELLDDAGVASRIRDAGREIRRLALHVEGTQLELELPSPALAVPQKVVEDALATALRNRHVELLTPYQALTIEQNHRHANVRVLRRELVNLGSPAHYSEWEPLESSVVRAEFVVGADGYDSRVRTALGIEPVNMGSTETFAMFEAESAPVPSFTMHLAFEQATGGVMLPLPDGRERWGFQIHEGLDAEPDLARLRALQAQRAPWYTGTTAAVAWGTVIHFERRLARPFGKHRVWLAGDAAHVTSPLGNQSINAGLVEASELAQRIADGLHNGRGPDELGAYASDRAREWHKLLGVNVGFDVLPHAPSWLAKYARRLVPALPMTGSDMTLVLEQLGLRLS